MYVKTHNGQVETYPYTIGQLRKDNPTVMFPKTPWPELLAEYGVYPVADVPMPKMADDKNVTEGTPVNVNGAWLRNWVVTTATPEELAEREARAWDSLRRERDKRLAATDWRITKGIEQSARDNLGLQIPTVWLDYRQALRDLPANTQDPRTPTWPTPPAE